MYAHKHEHAAGLNEATRCSKRKARCGQKAGNHKFTGFGLGVCNNFLEIEVEHDVGASM